MSRDFDIVVIGGGSGGYAAAKKSAASGLNVALVESADELGGLCILRGCMPTKSLLETSHRLRAIREAKRFGIDVGAPQLNLEALRERKRRLISGFQNYRVDGLHEGDFELIRGAARFVSPNMIDVEGEGQITAKAYIIATGSSARIPGIAGLLETPFWTSDDIVDLPFVPENIVVVGSGAVGMESAFLFQGLGSKVAIISRKRPLLSSMEPEISEAMEKRCNDLEIDLIFDCELERVSHEGSQFTLHFEDRESIATDQLIMATGRAPRFEALDLEKAGFDSDPMRLEIDQHCQTPVPHIFAVGDCASPVPVVHLAVIQGETAGSNAVSHLKDNAFDSDWDLRLKMIGIFTDPEMVHIGMTEKEASDDGIDVAASTYRYDDQGKGEIVGEVHGLVKMIADKASGQIVGASGMGPHVIDYSHTIMLAMHQRMAVSDFLEVPSYHPTLGEIWTYVAEELASQLD